MDYYTATKTLLKIHLTLKGVRILSEKNILQNLKTSYNLILKIWFESTCMHRHTHTLNLQEYIPK